MFRGLTNLLLFAEARQQGHATDTAMIIASLCDLPNIDRSPRSKWIYQDAKDGAAWAGQRNY
jgi:hypothetical protein